MIVVGHAGTIVSRGELPLSGGGSLVIDDYISPTLPQAGTRAFPLPAALAARQHPGSVSAPHFHDEDQFQVVVQGSGSLGRHAVGPITVHYTNRQTGYGPIKAGPEGLTYFTLRQIATKGTWYLESHKPDRLAPKRQVTVGPLPRLAADALRALHAASTETLIVPQPDGLAAWRVRVPPRADMGLPTAPNGTGRYLLVIGGALAMEAGELAPESIVFVSHDESAFRIRATAAGLEALVLQYPGGERVTSRSAKPASEQGPMPKRPGLDAPPAP